MNNQLVSILIPVYNAEKYVAEAIESALNQTYKNIEIIIVDDGSTDKSWEIIESYRQKHPKIIKTYRQENKGACAARNKAFELSDGKYIQYLDSDDLLASDKIEHQIKYFDGSGEDDFLVNGHWGRFIKSVTEDIAWGPHKLLQKNLKPIDWLLVNHMSTIASWLTSRKLINKAGKWDEELTINQDGEFFNRVMLNSKLIYFCNGAKNYYRSSVLKSISSSVYKISSIKSQFKTIQSFDAILCSLEKSERVNKAIKKRYINFIFLYYPYEKILTSIAFKRINDINIEIDLPGTRLQNKLVKYFGLRIGLILYSFYYQIRYGRNRIE